MGRIGHGYDVHRLGSRRPLVLGGVEIAPSGGPESHSDGDALLHAVANALLGAAGLGDLGSHFPDDDPAFRDAASGTFLAEISKKLEAVGLEIGNLDATVLLERPKLAPHRESMRLETARILGISTDRVNVKFGTGEGVGPVGRGESIEAHAVVWLEKRG